MIFNRGIMLAWVLFRIIYFKLDIVNLFSNNVSDVRMV